MNTIAQRLKKVIDAVDEFETGDRSAVTPHEEHEFARVFHMASAEGWPVRIVGAGSWLPASEGAVVYLGTGSLPCEIEAHPRDLVCSVSASVSLAALRAVLESHGVWLPIDAPGGERRTIGSIVATATAGPLRTGYGSVRDHVVGASFVTPAGGVVHGGGRVVKNVAGFDLNKLVTGSFGAFGCLTQLHLKVRVIPKHDVTVLATGELRDLIEAATSYVQTGATPAALELLSPAATATTEWTVALRLLGAPAVIESGETLARNCGLYGSTAAGAESRTFWSGVSGTVTAFPTTLRLGCPMARTRDGLDRVHDGLGGGFVSAAPATGSIRWSGTADTDAVRVLRTSLAGEQIPVILERAPSETLDALGHYGRLRDGVGAVIRRLRDAFDPKATMAVHLGGERG